MVTRENSSWYLGIIHWCIRSAVYVQTATLLSGSSATLQLVKPPITPL